MKTHQKIIIIISLVGFFVYFLVYFFVMEGISNDEKIVHNILPVKKYLNNELNKLNKLDNKNNKNNKNEIPEKIQINQNYLVKIFSKENISKKGKIKNNIISFLGHGILLNNNGYVLTNKHIVQNKKKPLYISYNKVKRGKKEEYFIEKIWRDEKQDLAIIKTKYLLDKLVHDEIMPNFQEKIIPGKKGEKDMENIPVWVMTSEKVQQGTAKLLSGEYQTDIPGKPGDSGSILLDTTGKIIGINTEINLSDHNYLYTILLSQDIVKSILFLGKK